MVRNTCKYKVIALHFTTVCNLDCPFCYRDKHDTKEDKPTSFFIDMVKYIKKLSPQIALGGGEPLMFPRFLVDIGKECKKHGVILNVTTNGRALLVMEPSEISEILENVTMISISLDRYKWTSLNNFKQAISKARDHSRSLVGVNLLVDKTMFDEKGKIFFNLVRWLFDVVKVDGVFALYPKNMDLGIDITDFSGIYRAISTLYPSFHVDDLTKEIIEQGYDNWKKPCHFGRDIASVNERGEVCGCSFDGNHPLLKMTDPEDILKVKDIETEERIECPYLVTSGEKTS